MPEYGDVVPIPDHSMTVDYNRDVWNCVCGADGRGDGDRDAHVIAGQHRDDAVNAIVPLIAPAQFAAALRLGGAGDSSHVAAVELLIRHEHWIGYGYLRKPLFVSGAWGADGKLGLRVDWWRVATASGLAQYVVDAIGDLDAEYELIRSLKSWLESNAVPPQRIHGSTSEMAILKIACSIAGRFPLNLGSDLSNLGNTNRGLVITAISHLLNHGGNLPMRAASTWQEY